MKKPPSPSSPASSRRCSPCRPVEAQQAKKAEHRHDLPDTWVRPTWVLRQRDPDAEHGRTRERASFTNFYTTATSSPTRSMLLTGVIPT